MKRATLENHRDMSAVAASLGLDAAEVSGNGKYCRISVDALLRCGIMDFDVWIALTDEKYVRVLKTGDRFEQRDRIKYETKGMTHLFIAVEDAMRHLKRYQGLVANLEITKGRSQGPVMKVSAECLQLIQGVARELGASAEVADIVESLVAVTVDQMRKATTSLAILQKLTEYPESYLSEHSVALAHLCGTLAYVLQWTSGLTLSKLVTAALLHDITLETDAQARIRSVEEMGMANLTAKERTQWLEHPETARDLCRQLGLDSEDVDAVIYQHHERPDGSGLLQMTADEVSPLAALFIVAEDMLHYFYEHRGQGTMEAFFEANKKTYSAGAFRSIVREMGLTLAQQERMRKRAG